MGLLLHFGCYLKTGDVSYALAGNAPYIVNRHTGEVVTRVLQIPLTITLSSMKKGSLLDKVPPTRG